MREDQKRVREQLDQVASQIIEALRPYVTIHRYDAYSTASIYLKFDYGLANSLRISDHPGKAHLSYRFNIGLQVKEPYVRTHRGFTREYFPVSHIDKLVHTILQHKANRINRYGEYNYKLYQNKAIREHAHDTSGFWSHCYLVSTPEGR